MNDTTPNELLVQLKELTGETIASTKDTLKQCIAKLIDKQTITGNEPMSELSNTHEKLGAAYARFQKERMDASAANERAIQVA